MSLEFDVFVVDPKPIPSAVPGFEEAMGPATRWPPTTTPAARSVNAAATSPISRRRWNAAPPRPSSSTG
jgi:hypothetical protein